MLLCLSVYFTSYLSVIFLYFPLINKYIKVTQVTIENNIQYAKSEGYVIISYCTSNPHIVNTLVVNKTEKVNIAIITAPSAIELLSHNR